MKTLFVIIFVACTIMPSTAKADKSVGQMVSPDSSAILCKYDKPETSSNGSASTDLSGAAAKAANGQ